jgi:hypothetical protein
MKTWGPSRFFLIGVVLGSLLGFVRPALSQGRGEGDPHATQEAAPSPSPLPSPEKNC